MLQYAKSSRSLVFQSWYSYCGFISMLYLHTLSVYLQDGLHRAGMICLILATFFIELLGVTFLEITLGPLFVLRKEFYERLKRRTIITFIVYSIVLTSLLTVAAVYSVNDEDYPVFNLYISLALLSIGVFVTAVCITLLFTTSFLNRELINLAKINQSGNTSEVAHLRLKLIQRIIGSYGMILGVAVIPIPIIFWAYGSVPYQFALWSAIMVTPVLTVPWGARFHEAGEKQKPRALIADPMRSLTDRTGQQSSML
jgi:hypothetical protein